MRSIIPVTQRVARLYPFHRGRSRLGVLLTRWLRPPRHAEASDDAGHRLVLDLDQQPSRQLFWFGEWEPLEMRHALPLIKAGAVVIDIGANVGITSLALADAAGSTGHVYAFEPDPSNLSRLDTNLSMNGMRTRVSTHAVALSDREGEITFDSRPDGSHSRLAEHEGHHGPTVATTRLDQFVADHGITRLDFVKMDVEGAEAMVIDGAELTLRPLKPTVLIEMDDHHLRRYGSSAGSLAGLLTGLGYCLFEVEGEPRSTPYRGGDRTPRNVLAVPDAA